MQEFHRGGRVARSMANQGAIRKPDMDISEVSQKKGRRESEIKSIAIENREWLVWKRSFA